MGMKVLGTAVAIMLAAGAINSCSFENAALLVLPLRPDRPIDKYIAGRLGVIEPTYARSHLVVAYRYLSGLPLTAAERQGARSLMTQRLGEPPLPRSSEDLWLDARRAAAPDAPPLEHIDRYGNSSNYGSYLNCTDDAFRTAITTLNDRVTRFGPKNAAIRSWISAQDMVFANCDGARDTPPPPEASLPKLIQKDRAYQIAAAKFYAADYAGAHDRFATIASDSDSPWSPISAVVAARCLIRQSTLLVEREPEPSLGYVKDPMAKAEKELQTILADPRRSSVHRAARQLLQYIRVRTEPQTVLTETARRLAGGTSPETFGNDLADYTFLLDDQLESDDPLTAWIENMKAPIDESDEGAKKAAYADAYKQWHARHELQWLVAALTHATGEEPTSHELLDAAKAVPVTSPAFIAVAYHRLRLQPQRRDLDVILALGDDVVPASARNHFLALRLPLTASLEEFLRDAPRQVVGYTDLTWPEQDGVGWLLDDDSVSAINSSLPLDLIVHATSDTHVPQPLDRMLLVAAFTRAHLLRRDDVAIALAPRLSAAYPEIAKAMQKFVKAAPAERKWEGINLLIHYPGLLPYVRPLESRSTYPNTPLDNGPDWQLSNTNWWCANDEASPLEPQFAQTAELRKQAAEEQQTLKEVGSGATYLLRGVVGWSKTHPDDPRIPEAMARAIRLTQWACPDKETRAAAKTAFNLLHARYPKSEWAKRTKYWYDGT